MIGTQAFNFKRLFTGRWKRFLLRFLFKSWVPISQKLRKAHMKYVMRIQIHWFLKPVQPNTTLPVKIPWEVFHCSSVHLTQHLPERLLFSGRNGFPYSIGDWQARSNSSINWFNSESGSSRCSEVFLSLQGLRRFNSTPFKTDEKIHIKPVSHEANPQFAITWPWS